MLQGVMGKETRNNGPALSLWEDRVEAAYPCVCNDVGDGGVGARGRGGCVGELHQYAYVGRASRTSFILHKYGIIVYNK